MVTFNLIALSSLMRIILSIEMVLFIVCSSLEISLLAASLEIILFFVGVANPTTIFPVPRAFMSEIRKGSRTKLPKDCRTLEIVICARWEAITLLAVAIIFY
jgi:hypothetical protein